MKIFARSRSLAALLLAFCMLLTPLTALAKKGEKNYNRGMQYEAALQWEKAAQEFALAVAASPSDIEYQLHYRRAIFNASQIFMERGRALADQGDFIGAYNAFRQAYGYDPVNLLAATEMDRMLRLQREKQGLPPEEEQNTNRPRRPGEGLNGRGAMTQTSAPTNGTRPPALPQEQPLSRTDQLKVINYTGELEPLVRQLADELNLNVVFDRDFSQQVGKRQVTYRLRDVTTARALDYIFAAQGLFFQKLDRRTILVADQSKRPQYQQLVLRTFYLYNIEPEEARSLIQQSLPANAGRQPMVTLNKKTNSITVRDTPENIRLISELLPTVDKDRAEVVMDVSIYEVSRTDLLQIGNQIGTESSLTQLGGTGPGVISLGNRRAVTAPLGISPPLALGAALLLPSSTLSALQSKSNTRLVFSTQVHAFDEEKSETRIGQKVPVQTASVTPFGLGVGQTTGTGTGTNQGVFSGGFPVIQYEDTGLSLDFTPKVFPNQDVQVKMVIDTKDAIPGANNLTPIFTQRRVTGTARIPNNRTILIASIAQDRQSDGRQGLPLVGLIPILGRLFATPRRDNRESDVVITMTPRVLRAPTITSSDETMRGTGSIQTPQSDSLEALLHDAEREDQLAAARSLPTNRVVQLPAPSDASAAVSPVTTTPAATTSTTATASNVAAMTPQTTASTATSQPAPNVAPTQATTTTNAAAPSSGEQVSYVPAPSILVDTTKAASAPSTNANVAQPASLTSAPPATKPVALDAKSAPTAINAAINSTATTSAAKPAATTSGAVTTRGEKAAPENKTDAEAAPTQPAPVVSSAELTLVPASREMRVGMKQRLLLMLKTDAPIGLMAATLRFDPRVTAVRAVSRGSMFDARAVAPVMTQSIDEHGVLVVSISPASGTSPLTGEGALLSIEIEAVGAGDASVGFDVGQMHLIATDGRSIIAQGINAQFKVAP